VVILCGAYELAASKVILECEGRPVIVGYTPRWFVDEPGFEHRRVYGQPVAEPSVFLCSGVNAVQQKEGAHGHNQESYAAQYGPRFGPFLLRVLDWPHLEFHDVSIEIRRQLGAAIWSQGVVSLIPAAN